MVNKGIEIQAIMYVYDLNNCAREFGFKTDEGWELNVATREEKLSIERKYHPTVATKFLPEILSELFGVVNNKLVQTKADIKNNLNPNNSNNNELQYLVAFNPKRVRP